MENWEQKLESFRDEWKREWEELLNNLENCLFQRWAKGAKITLLNMEDVARLLSRIGERQYQNGLGTLAKRVAEIDTEPSIVKVNITGEGSE